VTSTDELRRLPSVDKLLQQPELQDLVALYSHDAVADGARASLEAARSAVRTGAPAPEMHELVVSARQAVLRLWQPTLAPLINATGVIIHTNLGRAPLSADALAAVTAVAQGYSNLEFELETGERGARHSHLERLLARLTGAEAAMVVNNNAAAVLLALSALARRKEVIVSRGQAVEIGGGFRIPDVMRQSGAKLVEVGTTNRTYLADYAGAIGPRTAALLQVHSSNFRVIGFTEAVPLPDLCALGRRCGLPVINDLGSGSLLDTAQFGMAHEPTVQESVAAGAGLTCFSGDKLLGGPQAGLIAGEARLIAHLKRHPLARTVRVDKMTLAALQVTLLHYLQGDATTAIPLWAMIARPLTDIEQQAQSWAARLRALPGVTAAVVTGQSTVGGGSLPGETMPTRLVSIRLAGRVAGKEPSVAILSHNLRRGSPPIVARIERNALIIDPRTVLPGQADLVMQGLEQALLAASQSTT
jgi:L-seryl-tRNA(Ser) seleniumtransferase